ncbi:LysR family transcriptional regulator [Corynebacterium sp. HMSC06D04]|uniref:RidA family protein n=1 Tax=unclassified Corynebacterium TaxID=2624378 RepID=UPI0008A464DF|nr:MULTISPECIES: RidA family protein [unclassified Corynebacterium]OFR39712.1 LysR family transcriptional regulator [Corynebacterium sp. HMSC077D03]OFT33419.1 LysR family transcriptional regulator [Corynebacterium sp. HMSC08C04]OFT53410.1 LysR family transcriptional regulator [Corynebacterium sp. HMSC06D04]
MSYLTRLADLGYSLPEVAKPLASYVPAVRVGDQVWTSGQLPVIDGNLPATGKVGAEVSVEDAQEYARVAALNALAAIDSVVGLDNVSRVVKVVGFVASAPDFVEQAAVINGASDFIGELFGEAGTHARSAVGVAVLPKNSPVEVEVIIEISK